MTDAAVSLSQRDIALAEANRVRVARAAIKRDLKAGRVALADALEHPDCGSALVVDLLLALPRVGRTKANRAMSRARVSTVKTAGGMTDRQRAALLAELERWPAVRARASTLGPSPEHSSAIATKGRSVTGPRKGPWC